MPVVFVSSSLGLVARCSRRGARLRAAKHALFVAAAVLGGTKNLAAQPAPRPAASAAPVAAAPVAAPVPGPARAPAITPPPPAAAATPAAGQPTPAQVAQGREHFERGLGLFQANDFNGALAEFQLAYDLSRRPSVLFNLGVTYQALHQYPQAARSIEQFLREATDITAERREQVARALTEIRQYVSHIRIVGVPDGAMIRVDGERVGTTPLPAPLAVATGRHVIEAVAEGYRDASESVLIAGGQERDVRLDMQRIQRIDGVPATLVMRNVPRGARVELDGHVTAYDRPIDVASGTHVLRIRAEGFAPYEGSIDLVPGARRTITPRLASTRGITPVAFIVAGAAAVVLAGTAVGTGVVTLGTEAEFLMQTTDNGGTRQMRAEQLASSGELTRNLTNVFFIAAGMTAAASVILATQTRFGSPVSNIDLAAMPLPGGAAVSGRLRF